MPYFYIFALVYTAFKAILFGIKLYIEVQIEKKTKHLQAVIEKQQSQIKEQESCIQNELDKTLKDVAATQQTDAESIIESLRKSLPDVVSSLVEEQVTLRRAQEKHRVEFEYQQKMSELKNRSISVESLLETHEKLGRINKELEETERLEQEDRLKTTTEYAALFFALTKTPVEDVEKVLMVVKSFIEHGYVPADKNLKIAYNKKLSNAELKQFAINILNYNQKENYDFTNFLMTYFSDWFTGKRENILKNYNVLPKDSLVSKDGLEADLKRLRNQSGDEENS
ncbi:hypothetical protein AB9N12_11290 [Bacteroides sp. AN502(2024)]|uniref:hypothetical protein n=1 Tax=Bacteroides sp. AN502(2024) TaxID=3160599 RepID=UPI003512220E